MSTTFIEEFDEYGNVKSVANIKFTDKILGEGSFGIVRLAKRSSSKMIKPSGVQKSDSAKDLQDNGAGADAVIGNSLCDGVKESSSSLGSSFHSEGDIWKNTNFYHKKRNSSLMLGSISLGRGDTNAMTSTLSIDDLEEEEEDDDDLVAVKIYSKLVLKKMREVTRSSRNIRRMSIHDALEKVQNEIQIMKLMNHPNVVKLYEVIDSSETDTLYMVLEYVALGQIMKLDLDRMVFYQNNTQFPGLTKDGCYDEKHAALYIVDTLHGLEFLHRHHICHRDIKPENILVDARGYAKISDFGVSHLFEDEVDFDDNAEWGRRMSHIGNLTKREGTYSFWSPEMCNAKSASFSGYTSDLWASGVLLHILVSGTLPFYADDPNELFDLIIKSDTPRNAKFSKPLNNFIGLLLEKNPDDRIGIGEALGHPFCKKARTERIIALGPELMEQQLVGPLRRDYSRKSIRNRKHCTIQ